MQNKSSQNLKWGQIEALARGENPENAKYNKIKGDCSKSFSVDANGYVTIRGKKIKVGGGGGTYSAHYTDVQIDCPVGSMYVTCSECSCSAFGTINARLYRTINDRLIVLLLTFLISIT